MNLCEVAEKAKKELSGVTGLPTNTVISISEDDSGGWKAEVEMIERRSIPDSADLLGIYEVSLDEKGKLLAFRRKRTRKRADTETDEE